MTRLIAKSPCAGLLPLEIGGVSLSEVEAGPVHSVAPFKGKGTAVGKILKEQAGLGFPKPNRTTTNGDVRMIWTGPGQALLLGRALGEIDGAAVTDQSDAFAIVRIDGAAARDVLARLVPVDLSDGAFKLGATARTLVFHMTASVTRVDRDAFEIIVFRSMARTLVHDLTTAMRAVAARTAH